MKIDNFYGNARVIRIENHYAYGNEKTRIVLSYYDTLHDNITKRFFHKKRITTIIFFCIGEIALTQNFWTTQHFQKMGRLRKNEKA
jgi:hypothetical protein